MCHPPVSSVPSTVPDTHGRSGNVKRMASLPHYGPFSDMGSIPPPLQRLPLFSALGPISLSLPTRSCLTWHLSSLHPAHSVAGGCSVCEHIALGSGCLHLRGSPESCPWSHPYTVTCP